MLPNGTIVTYTGTWPYEDAFAIFLSPDKTVRDVAAKLQASGLISRSQPVTEASIVSEITGGSFQVTLQLQIENGLGFGTTDDVISVIRHWVYVVTGKFPSSDSIPTIQLPRGQVDPATLSPGTVVQTGQPGTTSPPARGCISGTASSVDGSWSLSCWWDNLTTKGLSTVGLLAIAIAVGLGIFIFARAPRITAI